MIERLIFLSIQVGATIAVILPLMIHWLMNRRWIREKIPAPKACKDEDLPFLCIVIPTWNEANVIEEKLDDTIAQRYPSSKRRIMLIDSASTDDTVAIARNWNDAHDQLLEIIEMPARLGKSAAMNRAMQELVDTSTVLLGNDSRSASP